MLWCLVCDQQRFLATSKLNKDSTIVIQKFTIIKVAKHEDGFNLIEYHREMQNYICKLQRSK